jgi:cellulose synthase/poly-beta-1,6-N-acetylglucosamine synthase-like glycosyltransferase
MATWTTIATVAIGCASIAAALPVLVLCAQVLLAQVLLAHRATRTSAAAVERRRGVAEVAVLIPAHDEAAGIAATLRSVQAQLREGDRLLVVADNCSDDTARIARQAGAEVIERSDATRRGKGFALDFGVRQLAARPPAVLLIVDADCLLDAGTIDALTRSCTDTGRPAQALYEMTMPAGAGLRERVSAFAWRVRNYVRPIGWWCVGAPCQLMGTGMAFPYALLRDAPLASGNIVEDVQLGVDLALRGQPPVFVPQARVTSAFPVAATAAAEQRRRWEHGNLSVMLTQGPRLLAAGLRSASGGLLAMAADLMVPPLALLLQLHIALIAIDGLAYWLGAGAVPLIVSSCALALLALSIVAAWRLGGRDIIGLSELLLTAPAYALRKLPMYLAFLWRRQSAWVRAKREGE